MLMYSGEVFSIFLLSLCLITDILFIFCPLKCYCNLFLENMPVKFQSVINGPVEKQDY